MPGREHRAFARADYNATAIIRYDGRELIGQVANISLNGIYVRSQMTIKDNTPVKIKIDMTGPTSQLLVNFGARVARHDEEGMGIRIEDMGIDSFLHWKNVVANACGDPELNSKHLMDIIRRHNMPQG